MWPNCSEEIFNEFPKQQHETQNFLVSNFSSNIFVYARKCTYWKQNILGGNEITYKKANNMWCVSNFCYTKFINIVT